MRRASCLLLVGLMSCAGVPTVLAQEGDKKALEVVEHCHYKNPGKDQRSVLSITLKDKDGKERKNVYRRLWKNYFGEDELADKMMLYTIYPPDAKGTGFMRWGYVEEAGKLADQWIYLPHMKKIRRVSVRDPGDSFLGSDLTYGDIEERSIKADRHVYVGSEAVNGVELHKVESTPLEAEALYSKKISYYSKEPWESCVRVRTDYYDRQGEFLKGQDLTWQKVKDAWVWKRVDVKNRQTGHSSIFEVSDVEVGVGLKGRAFTERALKKGYRE